jgi:hypothetical protein
MIESDKLANTETDLFGNTREALTLDACCPLV